MSGKGYQPLPGSLGVRGYEKRHKEVLKCQKDLKRILSRHPIKLSLPNMFFQREYSWANYLNVNHYYKMRAPSPTNTLQIYSLVNE